MDLSISIALVLFLVLVFVVPGMAFLMSRPPPLDGRKAGASEVLLEWFRASVPLSPLTLALLAFTGGGEAIATSTADDVLMGYLLVGGWAVAVAPFFASWLAGVLWYSYPSSKFRKALVEWYRESAVRPVHAEILAAAKKVATAEGKAVIALRVAGEPEWVFAALSIASNTEDDVLYLKRLPSGEDFSLSTERVLGWKFPGTQEVKQ